MPICMNGGGENTWGGLSSVSALRFQSVSLDLGFPQLTHPQNPSSSPIQSPAETKTTNRTGLGVVYTRDSCEAICFRVGINSLFAVQNLEAGPGALASALHKKIVHCRFFC